MANISQILDLQLARTSVDDSWASHGLISRSRCADLLQMKTSETICGNTGPTDLMWIEDIPVNVGCGARVLIVDDAPAVADTLAVVFEHFSYEARVAYSAENALVMVAGWIPDFAVLDVALPGMNGLDLSIVLNNQHPRCHSVLLSGDCNTGELLAEAARKGQEFRVLAKPCDPAELLKMASSLISPHLQKCA